MVDRIRAISGDSHVEIKPAVWLHHVRSKYREHVPQVTKDRYGGDVWVVEGVKTPIDMSIDLLGGKPYSEWAPIGQTYDTTPGCGSAEQRIMEQRRDGIDAEILFPSAGLRHFMRYCTDNDAHDEIVRGYNEWLAEEYCSHDVNRLLGIGLIPMTCISSAVAELHHCHDLGCTGVMLSAFPSNKGYPSDEDEIFWKTAIALEMPITIHVALIRDKIRTGPLILYPDATAEAIQRIGIGDLAHHVARFAFGGGVNAIQMILSGIFDRIPALRIYIAETHGGWIPFFSHMADLRYTRHVSWAERLLGFRPLDHDPSWYLQNHFVWGFMNDPVTVQLREQIGVNSLMWGSDFPHQESNWPESQNLLSKLLEPCNERDKTKLAWQNALDFFGSKLESLASCTNKNVHFE